MEQRLIPSDVPPPEHLRTPLVWLRRQHRIDAAADHEAVMASRDALRVWCDDDWPSDDFSLAENEADLLGHIEDAEAGVAYGYTAWDPSGERVLGSVYLEATAPFLDGYRVDAAARAAIASCDARVECWFRSDAADGFEAAALAEVRTWLLEAWPFRRPCWGSRKGMVERRRLLERMGMVEIAVIESVDGRRRFHFHADPEPGVATPAP